MQLTPEKLWGFRRMGGDTVNVLAWHRPDAGVSVLQAQRVYVKRIGEYCAQHDIPFVLELNVYPLASDAHQTKEYIEIQGTRGRHSCASA